jgi:hypothetical protein
MRIKSAGSASSVDILFDVIAHQATEIPSTKTTARKIPVDRIRPVSLMRQPQMDGVSYWDPIFAHVDWSHTGRWRFSLEGARGWRGRAREAWRPTRNQK